LLFVTPPLESMSRMMRNPLMAAALATVANHFVTERADDDIPAEG